MLQWNKSGARGREQTRGYQDELHRLLPSNTSDIPASAFPAIEVTKVALRLKYQIEQVIPCEVEEWKVVKANSSVITRRVVETAREAGDRDYAACVVYSLLVCKRWFKRQALCELWDADMHDVRAVACEVIAKQIIEEEEDQEYLLLKMLLQRYSVVINGEETEPANVIERAVDLHALRVIGSSGYQKCIKYLWRGWIQQNDKNTGQFVDYKDRANPNYWVHLDPDRMRAPRYQNGFEIAVSLIYLALYTAAVNTINQDGDLDVVEAVLYLLTFAFICDEGAKFIKVGWYYFGFWNAFNNVLYALLTASFVIRILALAQASNKDNEERARLNQLGYHVFAFAAPMFWARLMLYLDTFRFFGSMLVVVKVMMRESLIFFALLTVVCIGFLQAFIGLNQVEGTASVSTFVIQAMINSVMQSPDFDGFDDYAHPFGLILYYIFTFIVMVILLNVLIALYNSAYEDITGNAIDEYMALFAQKTIQFTRAPDENVFIAPFNLIEIFCLILPFEWWMNKERYGTLNRYVMAVIYSPLLVFTAIYEAQEARVVKSNRKRGEQDDDTVEEWEQLKDQINYEADGWSKKVEDSRPNVDVDTDVVEIRQLKAQVAALHNLIETSGSMRSSKD